MSSADESENISIDLKSQVAFSTGNIACDTLKTEVSLSVGNERSKATFVNGDPENREHEDLEKDFDASDDHPTLVKESFGSQENQIKKADCSTSGDLSFLVNKQQPQNIPASCTFPTRPLDSEGIITSEKGKLSLDIPERLNSESSTSDSDIHVQYREEVSNQDLRTALPGSKNPLTHQWTSNDKKSESPRESSESPCSEASASSSVTGCTEDSGICSTVRDEELDEIPLGTTAFNPEVLKKMSNACINDVANNWHPQTSNTYAPGTRQDIANADRMQEGRNMTGKPQKQKKIISLFSRSSNQEPNSVGWKLFGKLPPKDDGKKSVKVLPKEEPFIRGSMHRNSDGSKSSSTGTKSKFLSLKRMPSAVASSTTALILENRPSNLPAKSATEEKKHRRLYESMVAEAKKKELRDMKLNEKKLKEKCKQEDGIVNAVSIWTNEILPNFEIMRHSRRARELWWQGLPPSVRGNVWKLAIGNELHITHELFDIFQSHAYEKLLVTRNNKKKQKETGEVAELFVSEHQQVFSRAHTVELIVLDVSRTFPSLCIFQEGGPYHDTLHSILGAYTCYRPDMGYVQGMSFLAAVLLLNMEPRDAFICFANLLNKPCQMAFFRVDHPMMKAYFAAFDIFLEEFLPRIQTHFTKENFTPDMYLIDWFFTLFTKSLPLDVACRIWDVFCRDGDDFLFKTALGILKIYQDDLLCMDFVRLGQFLTKLPDDISVSNFFQAIASFNFPRQKFDQILAQQIEISAQIKSVASTTK